MRTSQKEEEFKNTLEKIEAKTGRFFSKVPFSPNEYTLSTIVFAFFAFYFLIKTNFLFATALYLLAVFFDFVDGALARIKKKETKRGAYLDTICDRYVEGIILIGFLFLTLPEIIFAAKIWIFLALFGSLMTTYAKAAAREKDLVQKEIKKGVFGRPARVLLVLLSLILGIFNHSLIIYPIIILAVFSNLTALSRIINIILLKKSKN